MPDYRQLKDKKTGKKYYPNTIVEGYDDDYGSYRKYANGDMKVTMKIPFVLSSNKAWGSLFISANTTMPNFPAAFINEPKSLNMFVDSPSSGTVFIMASNKATNIAPPKFFLVGGLSWTNGSFNVYVEAMGKWK